MVGGPEGGRVGGTGDRGRGGVAAGDLVGADVDHRGAVAVAVQGTGVAVEVGRRGARVAASVDDRRAGPDVVVAGGGGDEQRVGRDVAVLAGLVRADPAVLGTGGADDVIEGDPRWVWIVEVTAEQHGRRVGPEDDVVGDQSAGPVDDPDPAASRVRLGGVAVDQVARHRRRPGSEQGDPAAVSPGQVPGDGVAEDLEVALGAGADDLDAAAAGPAAAAARRVTGDDVVADGGRRAARHRFPARRARCRRRPRRRWPPGWSGSPGGREGWWLRPPVRQCRAGQAGRRTPRCEPRNPHSLYELPHIIKASVGCGYRTSRRGVPGRPSRCRRGRGRR